MQHITELRIENFKRIVAVTIKPDGSLVRIEGRNGQGKSSTIDAIWAALGGKAAAPPMPVRQGAEECLIRLKTEELVIERTFTPDGGNALKVKRRDGSAVPKPQSFLDALVGELTFDPLKFSEAPTKAQFDMIRSLVKGFDFEANATARKEAFDERTIVNREVKNLLAQRAGTVDSLPEGKRPERVDVSDVARQVNAAHEANAEASQQRALRTEWAGRAEGLRETAERLRKEAREADAAAQKIEDRLEAAAPIPEPIDVEPLNATLRGAEAVNAVVALFERLDILDAQLDAKGDAAKALTKTLERLDAAKTEAVQNAKLPIGGLTLGDDVVLLDGLPLEQASDAARLAVSLAVAGALNPELRIVRVKQGSLLDPAALELMAAWAEKNDLQIWLERVTDGTPDSDGFVIEDGALVQA